jgi:hypothetical protein
MSAIAPIFVHSGLVGDQATQVLSALTNSATVASDGTMTPVGQVQPGIFRYVDKRSGIARGYPTFSLSVREPVRLQDTYRVHGKLITPTLESNLGPAASGITPGPTEAYRLVSDLQTSIPARATSADKQMHLSYLVCLLVAKLYANDLAPSQVTGSPLVDALLSLEAPY